MFFQGMNLKNVWIFRLVTAFRTGVEQIVVTIVVQTWVVYMCSSLLQLAPGSRDLSQAEKKAEEIAKMRIVFIQNGPGPVKKNQHFE